MISHQSSCSRSHSSISPKKQGLARESSPRWKYDLICSFPWWFVSSANLLMKRVNLSNEGTLELSTLRAICGLSYLMKSLRTGKDVQRLYLMRSKRRTQAARLLCISDPAYFSGWFSDNSQDLTEFRQPLLQRPEPWSQQEHIFKDSKTIFCA